MFKSASRIVLTNVSTYTQLIQLVCVCVWFVDKLFVFVNGLYMYWYKSTLVVGEGGAAFIKKVRYSECSSYPCVIVYTFHVSLYLNRQAFRQMQLLFDSCNFVHSHTLCCNITKHMNPYFLNKQNIRIVKNEKTILSCIKNKFQNVQFNTYYNRQIDSLIATITWKKVPLLIRQHDK